ncbi:uncharacterized protein LOC112003691 [Quercus suber]|uniref:uncharacterized protein LOC112003691 n=1 Tax=Quercus suber TaxID=58331 RepID=UPI000CE2186E|nr:uncharacterized protein LOC112001128 [Quercus suber]XP_023891658.1 uncharacterized protein LOC112003691 [Quercus suber]
MVLPLCKCKVAPPVHHGFRPLHARSKVGQNERQRKVGSKPFRFEAMWLRDPRCEEVVYDAWEHGLYASMGHPLKNYISSCHAHLTQWNKREFGHVGRQIKLLKNKLQVLETFLENNMDNIWQVRLALNSWLDTEEVMWKQREGDRNTSFFHTKASNRKQRNWIQGLEDENGLWQEWLDDIEHVAPQYFSSLFTSSQPSDMTKLLEDIFPSITVAMNQLLARDFQASKIAQAIKQMHPHIALGPNGLPTLFYQRGLRQGDPLSPYLFLLCAKGLSALLHHAAERHAIHGIAVCRKALRISHLFFADNSLVFCRANLEECNDLQRIFTLYEVASGQQLNKAKTALYFSKNTPCALQEEIKTRFGAQVIRQHEKYLGLPSLVVRSKKNTFHDLKDKLRKKLARWKEKLLSNAGNEILIKLVAQAIPSYTMSCFKLPDSLCDELAGIVRKFWWGQNNGVDKMAWLS